MNELADFWSHLEELRRVLIQVVWIIFFGTSVTFFFHTFILDLLTETSFPSEKVNYFEVKTQRFLNTTNHEIQIPVPSSGTLKNLSPNARLLEQSLLIPPQEYADWEILEKNSNLLVLSPIEGFSISLKLSFWLGLVWTSPLWLYAIFQFIAPALHKNEKKLIFPFIGLSLGFIFLGVGFAYLITIPIANSYLYKFNENLGKNAWSLGNYMDYFLLLIFANAIAFELFAVILLLVHYGFLKAKKMQEKRRHFIITAFIIGALLTPPDILSQILLAIPLILLYELTIFYAIIRSKKGFFLNTNPN